MQTNQLEISAKSISELKCAHCGLPAFEHIKQGNLYFCCQGCKTAFSFLQDTENCQIPLGKNEVPEGKFAYLDQADVFQKWVIGRRGDAVRMRLQLPSIHCASCVQVLERLYLKKPGVLASQVNFLTKELDISFRPEVLKFSELVVYLSALGYTPSLVDPGQNGQQNKAISESMLLTLKMAVAGFCAGNIMLLSFPEYLGLEDASYQHFFGWLNLALALPAVFFSGWLYFKSVYNALVYKILNIDVPIGVGMIATLVLSLYEIITQTGSGYFDSLTGLIFFLLIGRWVQDRTYRFLSFERDFRSYFPLSITKLDGDAEMQILSSDIKPGDLLHIHFGEIIPCDGLIISGIGLIDYSFVSGESTPIRLKAGERVLAGGKQMSGQLLMRSEQEMSRSQLTHLWNNPIFLKEGKPPLRSFTDSVAYWFTPIILVFAVVVALVWLWFDPSRSLHAFLAVLIIACPCTLSLSYPIALGNTMRLWGKEGLFLKNAEVVERLSQIKTLVFDKTGTLTQRLGVEIHYFGKPLSQEEKLAVLSVLGGSKHPLSQSIYGYFGHPKLVPVFDFAETEGLGVKGKIADREVKAGAAHWVQCPEEKTEGSHVYVAIDGQFVGYFQVKSAPQPFVEGMLQRLKRHFHLHLLSGDRAEGQSFWTLLFKRLGGSSRFEMRPDDKLDVIRDLQQNGAHVAMIGDGLNDAGALRMADTGIAMASHAHQFTPGSDAILLSEKLPQLPDFMAQARWTMKVVRFSFLLSVMYNFIGLTFAVRGELQPMVAAILMPLNSLTMVLVAWLGSNHQVKG